MDKRPLRLLIALLISTLTLLGCQPAPSGAGVDNTAEGQRLTTVATDSTNTTDAVDLSGIKAYLLEQAQTLKTNTADLKRAADDYYSLAEKANFDYAALWQHDPAAVRTTINAARSAWIIASPLYEKMEGIVAGTPSLADYDVILDAGANGADDPENAVPFDLTLPNGVVLPKPGNLFGITESTLWGTFADYTTGIDADLDDNNTLDFGETLPDANVLTAGATALDSYAAELLTAAEAWQPTPADAFTALVVMVPTMNEYFGSWRDSRFVAGAASTQRDFVAISRLADMQDILGGLEVVYGEVQPLADTVDVAQGQQIADGLRTLRSFVADIYQQEQGGKRFTPEEADLLGAEAQNRATTVTGQISQIAAQLNIAIEQ
ncbi:MAG: imelysin family protein [Caldilineaceae bacterium]